VSSPIVIGHVVIKGMASVAMVHSIPELKVSSSEAANIGLEDQQRWAVNLSVAEQILRIFQETMLNDWLL
jgi:hypothetical protein